MVEEQEDGEHISLRGYIGIYTFRHRGACRIPAQGGQDCLTRGKEYRTTQNSVGQRN